MIHEQKKEDLRHLATEQEAITSERPSSLNEFIGQNEIKRQLDVYIESAKKQKKQLDHILLYGPAGLGKTTLAIIAAKEMGCNIKVLSAPVIEKSGDLAAILSSIKEGDFVFIDEIHRLKINIEEVLFPAMEDYRLDILIGKGPTAKSLRINLPYFTLIGATTLAGNISKPLRTRFGIILKLNYYDFESLTRIIINAFKRYSIDIDYSNAMYIAKCSRGTPRIALRLVRRIHDFIIYLNKITADIDVIKNALKELGIREDGLDTNDMKILKTIVVDYKGGPVGLHSLAVAIQEDPQTVEEFYEPYLIQQGLLHRTNKGRVATEKAMDFYKTPDTNLF